MSSKKNTGRPGDSLREQAEKVVRQTMSPLTETATVDETKFMSHELRVHEIELEMQNQELRKNEEVLAKARQRYYDLYDLAPVGYFTLSSDRVILEANLTLSTMLGLHRGALVSQPLSRYIRSEDQDIYYHFFNRLLSPGGPQACELRLVREGGTHFWAQLDANPAKGEDGSALIHAVVSDISVRKQAEERLIESEGQFRSYYSKNGSVMLLVDQDNGNLIDANPAAADYYGYPLAQLKQMNITDINTPKSTRN